jgi:hypothetical protein
MNISKFKGDIKITLSINESKILLSALTDNVKFPAIQSSAKKVVLIGKLIDLLKSKIDAN